MTKANRRGHAYSHTHYIQIYNNILLYVISCYMLFQWWYTFMFPKCLRKALVKKMAIVFILASWMLNELFSKRKSEFHLQFKFSREEQEIYLCILCPLRTEWDMSWDYFHLKHCHTIMFHIFLFKNLQKITSSNSAHFASGWKFIWAQLKTHLSKSGIKENIINQRVFIQQYGFPNHCTGILLFNSPNCCWKIVSKTIFRTYRRRQLHVPHPRW